MTESVPEFGIDDPGSVFRVLERAEALAEFGKLDGAIAELRRGIAEHPGSNLLWSNLAWYLHRADEWEETRDACVRALALDPDDTMALLVLVYVEIHDGHANRAHELADQLLSLAPAQPQSHLAKARAYLAEAGGSWKYRENIRQAAYYAISLEPESPHTLCASAGVMREVASQQEVAALVDRGLAIDPQHEGLLMIAADVKTKSDAQAARVLRGVLRQNPQHGTAAFVMEDLVWERTRRVAAFALWSMPALFVPFGLVVFGLAIGNLWMLVFSVRRSMPKGFLSSTWGEPTWAKIGVVLCFTGAAWPLLAVPVVLSGVPSLLAIPPLFLLAGETIVVLAAQQNERRRLLSMSLTTALAIVVESRKRTELGWVRIAVGALAGIVVIGLSAAARHSAEAAWAIPFAAIVGAAFAVSPILRMVFYRRLHREMQSPSAT